MITEEQKKLNRIKRLYENAKEKADIVRKFKERDQRNTRYKQFLKERNES